MQAVIVLGPFRGGTSVATGILQALGVFVGECFLDAETGYPTYEAVKLREQCLRCFDERENYWGYLCTKQQRVEHLREWYHFATGKAADQGAIAIGGKHPTMCMLVDELSVAWKDETGGPPLFLSIERPVEDVIRSWESAKTPDGRPWWPRKDIATIVRALVRTRDENLAEHFHLMVNFDELRAEPRATVKRIAETCELDLSRLDDAASLVRKRYNRDG